MPRVSQGMKKKYEPGALNAAIEAYQRGQLSMRKAAATFGVPLTTLHDHLSGKVEPGALSGRGTVFSTEVESLLVGKIQQNARMGFGITRAQLLNKAGKLARLKHLKTPWTGLEPGKDWLIGFMGRHPEISLRTPVPLTTVRARMLNRDVTAKYFADLGVILNQNRFSDNPGLIWNMDEKSVKLSHKPARVLAAKGERNVPSRVGNTRETVSVLAAVNAAGRSIPPMFIVKGKTHKSLNAYNIKEGPSGAVWTYQEKGYMEDILGGMWFEDHFLKVIGDERPQLLLMDGHSSHETLGLIEKARDANIILFALPPHTTHWLNPLDKTVFGPLEKDYNNICSEFMASSISAIVNKWEWPRLFNLAYNKAARESNVIAGFAACGVHPYAPSKISESAFAPSSATDWLISTPQPDVATSLRVSQPIFTTMDPREASLPGVLPALPGMHGTAATHPTTLACPTAMHSTTTPQPDTTSQHTTTTHPTTTTQPDTTSQRTVTTQPTTQPDTNSQRTTTTQPTTQPDTNSQHTTTTQAIRTTQPTIEILVSSIDDTDISTPTWTSCVNTLFDIPKPQLSDTKAKPSKKITTHRILTSDAIYTQKKEQEEHKQQELELKHKRKLERDEKKRVKEEKTANTKIKPKKIKVKSSSKCLLCRKCDLPCGGDGANILWIECASCAGWCHQVCVPVYLQEEMMACSLSMDMAFICPMCL